MQLVNSHFQEEQLQNEHVPGPGEFILWSLCYVLKEIVNSFLSIALPVGITNTSMGIIFLLLIQFIPMKQIINQDEIGQIIVLSFHYAKHCQNQFQVCLVQPHAAYCG